MTDPKKISDALKYRMKHYDCNDKCPYWSVCGSYDLLALAADAIDALMADNKRRADRVKILIRDSENGEYRELSELEK